MKNKVYLIIAIIIVFAIGAIFIFKDTRNHPVKNLPVQEINKDSLQAFESFYNRATQFRIQDKIDSSVSAYEEAIRLNPDDTNTLYYLGIVYIKQRDFEKAKQSWEKLINLDPESTRTLIQLGNLYFCMTHRKFFKPQQAEFYFKKANELNKDSLIPKLRLGEITLYLNKTKEALDIFNDLSAMDSKNVEVNFLNGFLNYKTGNETQAINYLKQAFLSAKADTSIHFAIRDQRQCNMFIYYTTAYITNSPPADIPKSAPEIYKEFDKYLVLMRDQLNPQ